MPMEYVERFESGYRVAGSRVSLDSIVYAFLRGESPEGIAESFPALTLEQVYGAVAYYLAHRDAIDRYLEASRADFDRLREQARRSIRRCTRRLRQPAASPRAMDEASVPGRRGFEPEDIGRVASSRTGS